MICHNLLPFVLAPGTIQLVIRIYQGGPVHMNWASQQIPNNDSVLMAVNPISNFYQNEILLAIEKDALGDLRSVRSFDVAKWHEAIKPGCFETCVNLCRLQFKVDESLR
jgi:hypothetical protein